MAELSRKDLILLIATVPTTGCQTPHQLIRLAGVDLSGLDLSGLNLSHADLAGANLRGCDLTDANLAESDLSHADLTEAVLRGIFAEGATFLDAKLIRVDFRPSVRDTFCGTQLVNTDFQGADLTGARLSRTFLQGARFSDATLTGADLSYAHVDRSTRFDRAITLDMTQDSVEWGDMPEAERPVVSIPMLISQAIEQTTVTVDSAHQKTRKTRSLAA